MTDLLERSLGSRIGIRTIFPLKPAMVSSDPGQLELAILNLVVNARDAMPDGGTVTIGAKEQLVEPNQIAGLNAGRYFCISIADQGEGMDDETLRRATEPFFTTKGVGKGTGLGLPMARGVAEQSGGQLTIESAKGIGTTVTLWLPSAEVEKRPSSPETVEPSAPRASRPVTVLTVDDDSLVLRNTALMLEDLGHRVIEAGSGADALKALASNPGVEIVITDQNMPGMTGVQLAAQIRRRWPEVKIVLATGYAEIPPGEGANLKRLGKPFTQATLNAAICEVAFGETPATTRRAANGVD
jgi:CheY-like chemotaxis protein